MARGLCLTKVLPRLLNAGARVWNCYAPRYLRRHHTYRRIDTAWNEVYSGLAQA